MVICLLDNFSIAVFGLTIVMHDELDIGTIRAIFRQACQFIPEGQLKKEFYSE